jgi:RNA polymerase sigma-70 factor, ECF subfamily
MHTDTQVRKAGGRLSREDQRRLGDTLQRVYDEVLRQGVPDRFKDLLDQFDKNVGDAETFPIHEQAEGEQAPNRLVGAEAFDKGFEIMTMRSSVRDVMLAAVPSLRAFAISLCGSVDRADDLVHETLLRAMANIDSFQPGTNMSAWLFTILRNLWHSEYNRGREVEETDGSKAESLKSHPEQHSRMEFEEFRVALVKLPPDQREALILVGASGFSYKEAAAICDCAVGTIKSRINRARTRLSDLLSTDGADDFGPDHTTRAILSAGDRGQ